VMRRIQSFPPPVYGKRPGVRSLRSKSALLRL
jgi:hypothetical protein